MKILVLEREGSAVSEAEYVPYLEDEARAVWNLAQAGVVREIYFRGDPSRAVLILEAENAEEGRAILAQLPLVQAGLVEFEVIELHPYPGYARLFAK